MSNSVWIISIMLLQFVCADFDSGNYETKSYYRREHSLVTPYQGSGMTIPNWEFTGATIVTQQFIRLTPDQQSKQGGIFNRVPITFPNWEIHVHFKIDGQRRDLFGDGMAFWYVKNPLKQGAVFGNEDYFNGLGIFLDTYANQNGAHNHGHPYISAMVNNGTAHYDHDRDGTHTEVSGCEAKIRGVEHDTVLLIRYENNVLTVKTNFEGLNDFRDCFSVEGVTLPTGYYIGLSAATGDLSDNHYVISVRTYELEVPGTPSDEDRSNLIPSADFASPERPHVEDEHRSMSNFKFFMLILCSIIGIVIVIAVGIMIMNKRQETQRKRFY